jgi:hypothetical protein
MPFTYDLWALIFGAIVVNAVAHIGLTVVANWKRHRKILRRQREEENNAEEEQEGGKTATRTGAAAAPLIAAGEETTPRRRKSAEGGAAPGGGGPTDGVDDEDKKSGSGSSSIGGSYFDISIEEISDAIYGSFGAFTNAANVEVENSSQKMLNIGFTFFLVIILASYTANLASNLISQETSTSAIADMDDANSRALSICVLKGTSAQTVVAASYPRVELVALSSTKPSVALAAVANGQCAGAVISKFEWDSRQNLKAANPYCNLVAVDYNIRPFSGAW